MEKKLDKLVEVVQKIHTETIKNTIVLEEHMKRSETSEKRLEVQESKLEAYMENTRSDLEPIKQHVHLVNKLAVIGFKLLGILGTIVGVAYTIMKMIE